jgi:PHP domain.
MSYVYETHSHTSQASKCGKVHGKDYIEYMKREGFDGMIITDHFFNGNSCVPKELPWKERVEIYVSGYEDAYRASKGTGFNVMFGIEYNFEGDEYLIYGVDKKWLLENGDILGKSRREVYNLVHQADGIMIQAHPFRERDYLTTINLTPSITDGIEIYNAANDDNMNALGYCYAKELGVPATAGSDIHFFYNGPKGGMKFKHKIETAQDYVQELMAGKGTPVYIINGKAKPVEGLSSLKIPEHGPTFPVCRF